LGAIARKDLTKERLKAIIIALALFLVGLIFVIVAVRQRNNSSDVTGTVYVSDITTTLPYSFKTTEAEQLSVRAFELRKAAKYLEAIDLYQQAIKIEPDNPKLFFDLSTCYDRTDRLDQAIQTLNTAIALDSSFAIFYNNRGYIIYNLHKTQKAINDFKKAIDIDSSNWIFHANIAMAYYEVKYFQEACKALEKSRRLGFVLREDHNGEVFKRIEATCALRETLH
jgi:tetratricopeptide (TPR) repeat protein